MGKVVVDTLDGYLRDKKYEEELVPHWVNYVCETVMAKLIGHKKPFKFVVTCMITQRTGAGVHSATSAHLDTVNDGVLTYVWPKEKSKDPTNKYMCALSRSSASSSSAELARAEGREGWRSASWSCSP